MSAPVVIGSFVDQVLSGLIFFGAIAVIGAIATGIAAIPRKK